MGTDKLGFQPIYEGTEEEVAAKARLKVLSGTDKSAEGGSVGAGTDTKMRMLTVPYIPYKTLVKGVI